ncbi:CPBP family intramembrane metalloprotease, partial [Mycobacterium tuberculosis]|nr:CPBP family intramembrane metalloprotease [Mycobacterium tuberculosis]
SIYPGYIVHVINNIVATLPFLVTFLQRIFS